MFKEETLVSREKKTLCDIKTLFPQGFEWKIIGEMSSLKTNHKAIF